MSRQTPNASRRHSATNSLRSILGNCFEALLDVVMHFCSLECFDRILTVCENSLNQASPMGKPDKLQRYVQIDCNCYSTYMCVCTKGEIHRSLHQTEGRCRSAGVPRRLTVDGKWTPRYPLAPIVLTGTGDPFLYF